MATISDTRDTKMMSREDGVSGVFLMFWAVLLAISLASAIIFSCAEGASKDKSGADDSNVCTGTMCGAECGAGCGG